MRKNCLFISALILFSIKSVAQISFTPGNLVVYKVGDGTDVLNSGAFPVNIDEYTTSGSFVQSYPLPTAISGNNKRIVASGSSNSEGLMTLSADGKFLVVSGYDTFPEPNRATSLTSSTAANVNRVVGIIDATGAIDATTALSDAYSTSNIRSATSSNGTDIWTAGTGTPSSSAGIRYTTKGSTTSVELSTTVTNTRAVEIYNGQLYCTSASGAFQGVSAVGTGLPTTSGQTIELLSGFPTASGPSPYTFSINPAGNIAYVADASSHTAGGGVQKWTLSAGTWTLAYTLDSGITSGINNLTVDWSNANPTIYGVTSQSSLNRIVSITDIGSQIVSFNILDTAGANYIFRGIAFTPGTSPVPITLTNFNASLVVTGVQLNWATTQEVNFKEFQIEKSTDGIHFGTLSIVASSASNNYKTMDINPADGINYYRLKMIDINGKYTYSAIAKVKYSTNTIEVYPNPTTIEITIKHPQSLQAVLLITDIHGRKVKTIKLDAGSTLSNINIENLVTGKYFIKYNDINYSIVYSFDKL